MQNTAKHNLKNSHSKVHLFLMPLILIFLTNCSNEKDTHTNTESSNINIASNSTKASPKTNASFSLTDSKELLNQAQKALDAIDQEFQWRDTHLIILKAQKALDENKINLSAQLSQKAIAQTQLMHQQQQFSNTNWQDLMPQDMSQ